MRRVVQISAVLMAVGAMSACDDRRSPVTPTPAVVPQAPAPAPAPAPVPMPGTLVIESFTVVAYPYLAMSSFYSPLIRVHAPDGAVTVTEMVFVIPGVTSGSRFCINKRVERGHGRDLLREIYGDYELSLVGPSLSAATGPARITLTYRDELGAVGVITAEGPVAAGNLPTTYTGGNNDGEWVTCR